MPVTLQIRLSEGEHTQDESTSDFELPTQQQLELMSNSDKTSLHLSGVCTNVQGGWNWVLSTGLRSSFSDPDPRPMKEFELQAQISKIEQFESDSEFFGQYLTGLCFYDAQGKIILECGRVTDPCRTTVLKEGERVIGVKARVVNDCSTTMLDVKFQIAH